MNYSKKIFFIAALSAIIASCKNGPLAVICLNKHYGCINPKGDIVIKPEWDYVLPSWGNKTFLVERDSLYGFVNRKGEVIIPLRYKDADVFYDGLAFTGDGKHYGFINTKGDTVISFIYDEGSGGFDPSSGLADVSIHDSCGYIDKKGRLVIPRMYRICYDFSRSGYAKVETSDWKELLINRKGQALTDSNRANKKLRKQDNVFDGVITSQTGQGRVNKKGDTIIPPIYTTMSIISEHRTIVQKGAKWGIYDDKGHLLAAPKYDYLWHCEEGYILFRLDGKWGYIDKKGKEAFGRTFDYADRFISGYAYVETGAKVGFIDRKGHFAIPAIYDTGYYSRLSGRFDK